MESFSFDEQEGEGIESFVFQALGAASMCWNPQPSNQIFDSIRAKEIGDALMEKIREVLR